MRWGEESNTEFLLLNLRLHHPRQVSIKAFTKREEVSNGADWEWWFISADASSYGMRVQAKRLHESNGTFGYLRYKAKSSPKNQMNNLIDEARSANLTPAYCFYAASDQPLWNPAWPSSEQPQTGCFVGHAEQVKGARSNRLSDLNHLLMPWHFLVCPCASDADSGLAHRAAAAMSKTVEGASTGALQAKSVRKKPWLAEVRRQPPSHVSNLMDDGETGDFPEGVLDDPEISDPGIKGILIIREHRILEHE
jgi:hypothetical protein